MKFFISDDAVKEIETALFHNKDKMTRENYFFLFEAVEKAKTGKSFEIVEK